MESFLVRIIPDTSNKISDKYEGLTMTKSLEHDEIWEKISWVTPCLFFGTAILQRQQEDKSNGRLRKKLIRLNPPADGQIRFFSIYMLTLIKASTILQDSQEI